MILQYFQKKLALFQKKFLNWLKNIMFKLSIYFSFKIRCKYKLSEIKTKIKVV